MPEPVKVVGFFIHQFWVSGVGIVEDGYVSFEYFQFVAVVFRGFGIEYSESLRVPVGLHISLIFKCPNLKCMGTPCSSNMLVITPKMIEGKKS